MFGKASLSSAVYFCLHLPFESFISFPTRAVA